MSDVAATNLVPDLDEARRFLHALEAGGLFQFQTFDDSKGKRSHLARTMYGTLEQYADELTRLNNDGAGVFVTVNRTDGGGRKAQNVTAVRGLFIDGDGIPLPLSWHCMPSIIVARDETHWHAYWLLFDGEKGLALEQFAATQKRLIQFYGSDSVIHDLPRVMRLPGFWHRKNAPVEVRIGMMQENLFYAAEIALMGLPELVQASPVLGGGSVSRADVSPTTGGERVGKISKLPRPDRELTETERAERYARDFPAPGPSKWNKELSNLVINLCSNFKAPLSDVAAIALDWSRRVRAHDAAKEAEAQKSIASTIAHCQRTGLMGNKWRPAKKKGDGRPLPEYDGTEARFEGLDDGWTTGKSGAVGVQDGRVGGPAGDSDRLQGVAEGGVAGERGPACADSGDGSEAEEVTSTPHPAAANDNGAAVGPLPQGERDTVVADASVKEEIADGQCEEPTLDDAAAVAGDGVSDGACEPDSILPKLPRVPAGVVADWFNDTLDTELRRIAGLDGTKRDEAVAKLYADLAARMAGVSDITKSRVKDLVCDKLRIGKRDYDRGLRECAAAGSTKHGSGGSGYIDYAHAFVTHLSEMKRAWKFWREEWYEWTAGTGCYQVQTIKWIKAEVGRWLSGRGVDVTTKIQTDFLANLEMLCIIHNDVKPGTWLGEDRWRNKGKAAIYVALKNGIVNLCDRAKGLLETTPDFFTLHVAPFNFDPEATCPKWLAAVEKWQPQDSTGAAYHILWDWMGYLFVPGNPHKKFLISVGPGDDGKSVYAGVCRALVGERNCCAVGLEQFDPAKQFGLTPLLGKMLNVIGDANHVEKVAEGTLKSLTGNDAYTFDRKNKDPITETWLGKIMINANATPYWRERADALYNRMLPLKWETIPSAEINRNLEDELKEELSGIFNWAMEGFDRIQQRNFVIPAGSNVWGWREEARGEAQHELGFFEQSIDYDKQLLASNERCYPEDLMKHYKAYCELTNVRAFCNNVSLAKQLRTWLRRRMILEGVDEAKVLEFFAGFYQRERGSGSSKRRWFYQGVVLLNFEQQDEPTARFNLS